MIREKLLLKRLHLSLTQQCKRNTEERFWVANTYYWTTTRLSTHLWFIILLLMIYLGNYFIHKIESIRLRWAEFDMKI
jgi:hypothetical protein